jgi:excisionase family DNA binding protein
MNHQTQQLTANTSEYYTAAEVACLLRVDVRKVLYWLNSGRLRGVNVGAGLRRATWRVRRSDLQSFEESRLNTPAPRPVRARRRTEDNYTKFFAEK